MTELEKTEVTFKTITQQVFKMTLPLGTTVGEIKSKIFEDRGDEFAVERQKLIYNGKVLEDGQTIKDVSVDEKKYIVVMVSRKKVEQPAVAQSSSSSNVESSKVVTAAKTEPAAAASELTDSTHASAPSESILGITPEQEESVNMICVMGYPREEVIRALRAAFWDADRAVEYLCTGIPETVAGVVDESPILDQGSASESEDPLSFLRDSPQFAQLCQIVREQPETLPQVLAQISSSNPNLMQIIRENQEAFVRMLNEGTEGEQGTDALNLPNEQQAHESGHLTIAVTETDRNAIQRLQSMGFPEQLVIEAYFACDKNEDLAVNYILSRLDEVQNEND